MGNDQSLNQPVIKRHNKLQLSQIRDFEIFESFYTRVKAYEDSRYGEVFLYKPKVVNPNQAPEEGFDFVLVKEKWRNRQNQPAGGAKSMTDCIDLLPQLYDRAADGSSDEYVAKMLGHFREEEAQFCTNYVKHRIGFVFHAKTLKMELASAFSTIGHLPKPEIVNGERIRKFNL
jgi:hypothetical protein